jgi:glutamate racemase
VFDSGMGGLTVLRALQRALPGESFVYLGDTARLPYGSKSPATVERYALQATEILVHRGIRALVVACNTASAFALCALRRRYPALPVFGVVEPGAVAAAEVPGRGSVLVLATESTVLGGAYQTAILRLRPDVTVLGRACPLLVTLAEEGEHQGVFCRTVLGRYLEGYLDRGRRGPGTVVLGCTHFPVFRNTLAELIGGVATIVDSAETTASVVAAALPRAESGGALTLLATDGVARFRRVGGYFLGAPIGAVELVDL